MSTLTNYGDGFAATGYPGSSTIGPAFAVVDTGTPDATLQVLGPDGATYIAVAAAITANGFSTYFLPAGQVRVTSGTGTSLSALDPHSIPSRIGD